MPNRAMDWRLQAERDLEQARDSQVAERHEWACFASHQAAGKGVKALHLYLGQEAWGHVIARLLKELPVAVSVGEDLINKAKVLDNFYIPSRYPNAHPSGAPFEHYSSLQSQKAIQYASEILEFARAEMAWSRKGGFSREAVDRGRYCPAPGHQLQNSSHGLDG